MKLMPFLKDKFMFLILHIICMGALSAFLRLTGYGSTGVTLILIFWTVILALWLFITYRERKRYFDEIDKILAEVDQRYLLGELLPYSCRLEDRLYNKMMHLSNKSVIEKIRKIEDAQRDYREYIESWVHEIKIPITSSKLLCENNKSEITNKIDEEIEEINNYVEQVLFYARLDQVSNDFMIQKVNLEETIRNVLARNKKMMIHNGMKVETKNIELSAYTDEKWLEFILNQIIINAIQYRKEKSPEIVIELKEMKENVKLSIKDNGIGIKKSEIDRIFDKGFTGTNGRNQKKSTGIGLYLCKRLCEELGMIIEAQSKENEYTNIIITIPRTKKLNEE